jgi:hypothetical protein
MRGTTLALFDEPVIAVTVCIRRLCANAMQSCRGRVLMAKLIYMAALALALGASALVQLNTYTEIDSLAAVGGASTDAAPLF